MKYASLLNCFIELLVSNGVYEKNLFKFECIPATRSKCTPHFFDVWSEARLKVFVSMTK